MSEIASAVSPHSTVRAIRPPDELRRVLGVFVAVVLILIVSGSGVFLSQLRAGAIEAARVSTAGLAGLLDEHLTRTLKATDTILRRMILVSRARLAGRISPAEELQELLSLQDSLPERGTILVVDSAGRVTASDGRRRSSTGIDFSDRAWFQAHLHGTEMVVGPLLTGRFRSDLIFTISRRIVDDNGQFVGAVVSGIDAAFFTDFYNSQVVGRQGYVAADTAGYVMLRQPNPERYAGISVKNGQVVLAAATDPSGTLWTVSPLDGVERIVSYRTLAGFDVVVSAGMSVNEVLGPWRQTMLVLSGAMVVVVLSLLGLAALAYRSVNREETVMDGLERAVAERTEEAEHRAEEARQANDSKTRFLAAASHDLRQPLQAAGMFAEVLAGTLDDPRQVKVVDKLRQSIEATNSLLTTLLDVSALEAGKIKPNVASFRVMPLLTGLVEQIEPEASARRLSIGVVPTRAVVCTDPVLLERLLRNLILNAIRYTRTGGVLIGCRHRGDRVVIQVWDTGIGIPADKVLAVFDDFVRLDEVVDAQAGRGLGLGLGVVRRMAALLGLELELRSTLGKGSCFGVVLPRGE